MHLISEALIAQTRTHYSGPLQGPEDLLVIDVGEQSACGEWRTSSAA